MPDPLKKNREKFYYNKTGIDIQNPVTPERSYEIPFELKRSVPTHISREEMCIRDRNGNMTLYTLEKICKALDCNPEEVVEFTDDEDNSSERE